MYAVQSKRGGVLHIPFTVMLVVAVALPKLFCAWQRYSPASASVAPVMVTTPPVTVMRGVEEEIVIPSLVQVTVGAGFPAG